MSIQSMFNRYGVSIDEARRNKAAREKQTITRAKKVRPRDSYRGARSSRAGYCGKWGLPHRYAPGDRMICTAHQSVVRRHPGKYMPHNARYDGGQYKKTVHVYRLPVPIVNTFRGFGGRNR